MAKKTSNIIGAWAFLIGVVVALVVGLFGLLSQNIIIALVIIGIIIGLFNIADKEASPFMMSGVVLIIASAFGRSIISTIPQVADVLTALMGIFVPATIVVAIRNVFSLARN